MHTLIEQADALAQQQVRILQGASALYKISPLVRGGIFLFVVGIVAAALVYPYSVGLLLFIMGFVNYMLLIAFRMGNNLGQLKNNPGQPIQTDPVIWPSISIIVPLKREGEVVYGTLQAIADLDYPTHLKQVVIVVEETDQMTLGVLGNIILPDGFELLQIPEQPPFTKGRALLHALRRASGELVTVYDAESRPEPQQLRKAARILKQSNDAVLCLQAKIKISNQDTNWITRNFAGEYYEWYERHLQELSNAGLPFGLGGNSFFIARETLVKAGAWDPFNVTEDADMAVRLIEKGVKIRMMDSVTTETCPEKIADWTNQRTRWNKGLFVTQLVHLIRSVGIRPFGVAGWINFWLPMLCAGLIPFFNTFVPVYLLFGGLSYPWLFVMSTSLWGLLCINLVSSTLINKMTYNRLGIAANVFYAFFDVVAYLILHLGAGYKAYLEYFWSPLHWHKTVHKESQMTEEPVLNF